MNLAKPAFATERDALARRVDRGEVVIVVTPDILEDFTNDPDVSRAFRDAARLDVLYPVWLGYGQHIYAREAFAEYLRLMQGTELAPVRPGIDIAEGIRNCLEGLPLSDDEKRHQQKDFDRPKRIGFSKCVEGWYEAERSPDADRCGVSRPSRKRDSDDFNALRERGRSSGAGSKEVEAVLRGAWQASLSEDPIQLPDKDKALLPELSGQAEFDRMPAWNARKRVEEVWLKDQCKSKASDKVDMDHVAILPYVDVFATEKHLANMLLRSQLGAGYGRVVASLGDLCLNT